MLAWSVIAFTYFVGYYLCATVIITTWKELRDAHQPEAQPEAQPEVLL